MQTQFSLCLTDISNLAHDHLRDWTHQPELWTARELSDSSLRQGLSSHLLGLIMWFLHPVPTAWIILGKFSHVPTLSFYKMKSLRGVIFKGSFCSY